MEKKVLYRGKLEKSPSTAPQYVWVGPKQEVAIFLNEKGLQVFSSLCPHMGAQLEVSKGELTCPWHGLQFSQETKCSKHFRYKKIEAYSAEMIGEEIIIYEKSNF